GNSTKGIGHNLWLDGLSAGALHARFREHNFANIGCDSFAGGGSLVLRPRNARATNGRQSIRCDTGEVWLRLLQPSSVGKKRRVRPQAWPKPARTNHTLGQMILRTEQITTKL
ncbi:unnamed protein product, partial [Ectocarpus sp. 8 AP-2014]